MRGRPSFTPEPCRTIAVRGVYYRWRSLCTARVPCISSSSPAMARAGTRCRRDVRTPSSSDRYRAQRCREILASADLYVCPSEASSTSLAVLEAQASGLPVVVMAAWKCSRARDRINGAGVPLSRRLHRRNRGARQNRRAKGGNGAGGAGVCEAAGVGGRSDRRVCRVSDRREGLTRSARSRASLHSAEPTLLARTAPSSLRRDASRESCSCDVARSSCSRATQPEAAWCSIVNSRMWPCPASRFAKIISCTY